MLKHENKIQKKMCCCAPLTTFKMWEKNLLKYVVYSKSLLYSEYEIETAVNKVTVVHVCTNIQLDSLFLL